MDSTKAASFCHIDGEARGRARSVTWSDRRVFEEAAADLTGLEFLRAMTLGEVPSAPMMELLGMRIESAGAGEISFCLEPEEFHCNPTWSVHGGVYATLLDSAAACAVHTTLPAGSTCSTLDLSVRFIRPVKPGAGTVTATGKVVHSGRNIALAEARLEDGAGVLLATATANCFVKRSQGPNGAAR